MSSSSSSHGSSAPRRLSLRSRLLTRGAKTFGKSVALVLSHAHRWGAVPGDRHVEVIRDVPYADRGGKQSVDVYLPRRRDRSRPLPFMLHVHGGGWVTGDRKMGALIGRILASRGIAVVTPGYRLAPAHDLNEQLEDLKTALAFVLDSAHRWNLDAERYALSGESAGAHLAMRLLQEFPERTRPRGAVGFYGPYDLDAYRRLDCPVIRAFLETLARDGDVDRCVSAHCAMRELPFTDLPVLLFHGSADNFVSVRQSIELHRLLRAQGVPVELKIYPGSGHGFNYQKQMKPHHTADAYRELVRFFREHVGE